MTELKDSKSLEAYLDVSMPSLSPVSVVGLFEATDSKSELIAILYCNLLHSFRTLTLEYRTTWTTERMKNFYGLSHEANIQKTGGGNQAGWVWQPCLNIKRVLIGHTGKEGVWGLWSEMF